MLIWNSYNQFFQTVI